MNSGHLQEGDREPIKEYWRAMKGYKEPRWEGVQGFARMLGQDGHREKFSGIEQGAHFVAGWL
ncbi:hypothetical protein BIY27_08995 [Gibbsiella quercinecans]|uniref:Uncharacterized protein n=1 Tax=Gibbsiella quercinecans TaxID=929813 RepID=A0A250B413_9GAMM|nr:hypothetical protein AWC35_16720 [Gibbsiella quercinecans]RLM08832.1 hypothetical protein BIY31_10800 [Gibbsiella quercinecans]RLM10479.1 hypothetical protein BIY30_09810 [Gibbsiella quercinecans]RLM14109.1 hypothetical protein BIY27_08995 [Gibbsiella quercinecans]